MGRSKLSAFIFSIFLGISATASAQGFGQVSGGFALSPFGTFAHIGGGGETSTRGVSAGAEIGSVLSRSSTLLLSVTASNHFGTDATLDGGGFVKGGIVFVRGLGPRPLATIGGGYDRWLDRHTGVRFEVQDQFAPLYSILPLFFVVRVGVLFR
jgi:hypothetical protein